MQAKAKPSPIFCVFPAFAVALSGCPDWPPPQPVLPPSGTFGMIIASLAFGYFFLKLDPILGFWLAYILTRPLGASFGDLLSQPAKFGGMGLGTIITSALFLGTIIAIVIWISITRRGEEAEMAN